MSGLLRKLTVIPTTLAVPYSCVIGSRHSGVNLICFDHDKNLFCYNTNFCSAFFCFFVAFTLEEPFLF